MTKSESDLLSNLSLRRFTTAHALLLYELIITLLLYYLAIILIALSLFSNMATIDCILKLIWHNLGLTSVVVVFILMIPVVVCSFRNVGTRKKIVEITDVCVRTFFWCFVLLFAFMIGLFICILLVIAGKNLPSAIDSFFGNFGLVASPVFMILAALFFCVIPMAKDDGSGISSMSWMLHFFYWLMGFTAFIMIAANEESLRGASEQEWVCRDFHPLTHRFAPSCTAYDRSDAASALVFLVLGLFAMTLVETSALIIAYYYQFHRREEITPNLVYRTITYPICGVIFFVFILLAFGTFKVRITDAGISSGLSTFIVLLSITYLQKIIEWYTASDSTAANKSEI
ncbi:hypothetical protein [Bifidobacterium sp. ESL0704]|uniref:hypothetical protein n=1 Tax=Bifidobacterium sp. ESL0704 TaxID=2983219 RepID=UPI0023F896E6|nr:hypothetical protein [Bifidobacterium sp. ESL0704]WEV52244.1 hypothetical protein OZX64_04835 [Bifidobacterium sp. ESL0704]